ncbi:MAG: WYL domain-containing protein, partial [Flavobacteriales bacterium]|nr:WYL domain-containing protein [Flavobacteriales bacterium]
AATLFQFRDLAMFKDFGSAIGKIFDRMNISPLMQDEAVERHVQFETTPEAEGTALLPALLGAIKHRQEVQFRYRSFLDGMETERTLHPYLLKEYRNRWYVIGRDTGRNGTRTFGVDRISDLSVSEKFFQPDAQFDPDALFRHSFGITAGGIPVDVVLRFGPRQAQFVRAQPLHPTQEVVSEESEGITVRIRVIPSAELTMTVLSYGDSVEVVSPAALRTEVAQALAQAAARYR